MNELKRNQPDIDYPPSRNDIENVQHYITTLETELIEGLNNSGVIKEYGNSLIVMSSDLHKDGYLVESRAMCDLGMLTLSALDAIE